MRKFKIFTLSILFVLISASTCFADDYQNGVSAYANKNYSNAVLYFRNVLSRNSNNPAARYYLAISLHQLRRLDEAKREYMLIMSSYPNTDAAERASIALKSLTTPAKTKTVIKFDKNNSSILVNDVSINNSVKSTFVLDTGATYSSISPALARKLGVNTRNAQYVKVISANGAINVPKITLSSIEIDGLVANNVEVIVHDIGAGNDIAGLLGLSFMQNFKVTLDKPNGTLTLEKS